VLIELTHAYTRQNIKTCRKTLSRELKKARTEKERKYRKRLWAVRNVRRYKIEYVAEQVGVVVRTVYRWLKRYREEGKEGLKDNSKRLHTIHKVSDEIVKRVIELRVKYGYGAEKIGNWVVFHNYSRIHFTSQYYQFGEGIVRKKLWFIPYLRFVAHRC